MKFISFRLPVKTQAKVRKDRRPKSIFFWTFRPEVKAKETVYAELPMPESIFF